uniref:Uncharacterized protein n=1 Tax=Pipistrellus kuhlii TaxID=59472 RepID=A0A7J8B2G4_PIPKU|nr:hypothetical protein mPipKuh1_007850 [Pipistrellus kuhlii]
MTWQWRFMGDVSQNQREGSLIPSGAAQFHLWLWVLCCCWGTVDPESGLLHTCVCVPHPVLQQFCRVPSQAEAPHLPERPCSLHRHPSSHSAVPGVTAAGEGLKEVGSRACLAPSPHSRSAHNYLGLPRASAGSQKIPA